MTKLASLLFLFLVAAGSLCAQTTCNPNGNLVIYSNYDGGTLNINVDVNIPNIVIGVVGYEVTQVNVSGTYASNVVAVRIAGYGATNNHCPPVNANGFSGTSASSSNTIVLNPTYNSTTITSGSSCSNSATIQGYFLSYFPGTTLRMHKAQYGCWMGTQSVSGGGNCCPAGPQPLTVGTSFTAPTCYGSCNGSVTATAANGTPPYSYQWSGGPTTATWGARCAGTYTVTVTDGASATATSTVTVTQPAIKQSTFSQAACSTYFFNGATRTVSGTYLDTLTSGGCDSFVTLNLTIAPPVNVAVNQAGKVLTASATGATYQWIKCPSSNLIAGATAQVYTAPTNGQYAVIVTQGGCADTSACKTVTGVGIGNVQQGKALIIYPNPAKGGQITIEAPAAELAGKMYKLFDAAGRVVLEGRLEAAGVTTVDIAQLAAGAYTLKVAGAEGAVRVVR